MTTTEAKTVKLSELMIDPANVRQTGRGEEPKFAASIRKRGVLEPLLVRKGQFDGYKIINGGERYTALMHLAKKGEKANGVPVTGDFPVRVEVTERDTASARATSLATNLVRVDMHPVDQFEAFAAMIADGATVESIAAEYAMKVPQVRQALSLAAIAPEIRKAWREGKIDGEAAEAYAQTKDLAHQVRVFNKLKGRAGEEWAVNEEIAGGRDHDVAKMLKFVGQKEYEAAGHHVNASLFADDERDMLKVDNVPALKAMTVAKLVAECERLKMDGWGWAILKDEAPKDIYSWRKLPSGSPTKEQKALAGCTVDITYTGALEVTRGYVKPGVSVRVEKTPAQKAAFRKAARPKKTTTISAALARRMSEALTRASAKVVGECDQDTVLRLALAGLMCSSTYSDSPVCLENKGADVEDFADYEFDEVLKRLAKAGRPALLDMFAKTVGTSIELGHASPDRMLVGAEDEGEAAAAFVHFVPQKPLQAELRREFDAGDYFENAPGAMALAALADVGVVPLKNAKKAALAKQATDAAKKAGWLPPQLRTEGYEGPKAKTARKKRR